jgi:Protein of unknown function (DUF3237)
MEENMAKPATKKDAPFSMPSTGLVYVFTAGVKVAPTVEFAGADGGIRRMIPITGGTVTGPRLQGEVLNGGADWQAIRPDGAADLVARYALKANDGTVISVINSGIRRGPPEVLARMKAGEILDPALYYFRAAPVFDVGPGPHQWLTENIFVSAGARFPDEARLDFYMVT